MSNVTGKAISMSDRIQVLDWSQTPIGPMISWPQSLKATIKTILGSRYPMILIWGDTHIQIYNDAYTKLIGDKHPYALGRSIIETQTESWETIGPMIRHVMTTGIPNWVPAQLLMLHRSGFNEETYFSLSYSAVEDDNDVIKGMLCVCSEVTQQVLGERRLKLQRDLASKAGETRSVEKVCQDISTAINDYRADVPFMALYIKAPDGHLKLSGSVGTSFTKTIDLHSGEANAWSMRQALSGETVFIDNVPAIFSINGGMWQEPVQSAFTLPIPSSIPSQPLGVLIAGISPNCALDDNYKSFYELLAGQVSIALRNAMAYEEERKRAEALAEIDKAKTDFFSNVSHEFRTPLTLMLGPLEEILEKPGHEEDRQQLLIVYQNALRLLKLVNALLDFSRIEANRTQAAFAPVDLSAFTKELASSFESAIHKASLDYTVDCQPLSTPVYIDQELWEKIVFNLISNALKFTFEGSIAIALKEAPEHITLTVSDTGVGIPPHELPNIFKRFHRIQNTRSRSHEGTGIGLALVKELVLLHGGNITVNSVEGTGTSFSITIPKGTAHLNKEFIRAVKTSVTGKLKESYTNEALLWSDDQEIIDLTVPVDTAGPYNNDLILVVDDNIQMREYLQRLLEARWKVMTAKDGVQALNCMQNAVPDLVLSDVMMPNMNGFELLAAIRKNSDWNNVPVILLSARAGQEATVEGLQKGANDYLVKPFYARELIARVAAQLDIKHTRLDNVMLEKKVEERTRDLKNTNKELEQFAFAASHDLQEPLRKILTFSELLDNKMTDKNAVVNNYLQKIILSSERMKFLINDLLNFSRLSDIEQQFQLTDLNSLVKELIEDFELSIMQKEAVLTYDELPEIEAIPLQMNQLFYNLIGNALKFTAPGRKPVIAIHCTVLEDEALQQFPSLDLSVPYYRIDVKDNGIGFEPQYAEQIFTIFKRLHTRDTYSGTGIGLALCRKIVLKHKGEIFAGAMENEGSTFTVILPKKHIA